MKIYVSMMKWAFALSVLVWATFNSLDASASDPPSDQDVSLPL